MNGHDTPEYPVREAPAFRGVIPPGSNNGPATIEIDGEVYAHLHFAAGSYDETRVPISKRALIDALQLAAALDGGYIKAEETIAFLIERQRQALLDTSNRIVNEGDRKRGEALALRGITVEEIVDRYAQRDGIGGNKETEPREEITFSGPGFAVIASYPKSMREPAYHEKVGEIILTRLANSHHEFDVGDVISVASDVFPSSAIPFRIEHISREGHSILSGMHEFASRSFSVASDAAAQLASGALSSLTTTAKKTRKKAVKNTAKRKTKTARRRK